MWKLNINRKYLAERVISVMLGLLIAILAGELFARVYLEKTGIGNRIRYIEDKMQLRGISEVGCFDKDLGWGLKPLATGKEITSDFSVTYSINSKGIRDEELPFNKIHNELRILALGESNVFGWGVAYGKRFSEVIEEALNNVEVINMGIAGFGLDQSLLQLNRDGFKFHPDLIVLFVYDDFIARCKDFIRDFGEFKPRYIVDGTKELLILQDLAYISDKFSSEKKILSAGNKPKSRLIESSKLCTLLKYYIINYKKIRDSKDIDSKRWNNVYFKLSFVNNFREKYNRGDYKRLVFLLFKEYQKVCHEHNVPLLVIGIGRTDISGNLADLGIPFFDLSNVIANAGKYRRTSFNIDPHFNEFTHRVMGEYAAEYIKNKYNLKKKDSFSYKYLGMF